MKTYASCPSNYGGALPFTTTRERMRTINIADVSRLDCISSIARVHFPKHKQSTSLRGSPRPLPLPLPPSTHPVRSPPLHQPLKTIRRTLPLKLTPKSTPPPLPKPSLLPKPFLIAALLLRIPKGSQLFETEKLVKVLVRGGEEDISGRHAEGLGGGFAVAKGGCFVEEVVV